MQVARGAAGIALAKVGAAEVFADRFRIGQRIAILPNHACAVSNLHDRVYGVRAGRVEAEWRVAARGRVD